MLSQKKQTNKASLLENPLSLASLKLRKDPVKQIIYQNKFCLLVEDEDEDEELSLVEYESAKEEQITYAKILDTTDVTFKTPFEIPKLIRHEPEKIKKRWADYDSDSDYESDEFQECNYYGTKF